MHGYTLNGDLFLMLIGVIEAGVGTWHILLAIERGRINQSRYGVLWLRRAKEPERFKRRLWADGLLFAGISGFFLIFGGAHLLHSLM